jgi:hypothetical protein
MVQYYQDMWAKCSKMLAPLSNLLGECVGGLPGKTLPIRQVAFNNIKATIVKEVALA